MMEHLSAANAANAMLAEQPVPVGASNPVVSDVMHECILVVCNPHNNADRNAHRNLNIPYQLPHHPYPLSRHSLILPCRWLLP